MAKLSLPSAAANTLLLHFAHSGAWGEVLQRQCCASAAVWGFPHRVAIYGLQDGMSIDIILCAVRCVALGMAGTVVISSNQLQAIQGMVRLSQRRFCVRVPVRTLPQTSAPAGPPARAGREAGQACGAA